MVCDELRVPIPCGAHLSEGFRENYPNLLVIQSAISS
jgi:hypothetical protein